MAGWVARGRIWSHGERRLPERRVIFAVKKKKQRRRDAGLVA